MKTTNSYYTYLQYDREETEEMISFMKDMALYDHRISSAVKEQILWVHEDDHVFGPLSHESVY